MTLSASLPKTASVRCVMDELDAAVHLKVVIDLVKALANSDIVERQRYARAYEAIQILWSCYEDCALSANPVWTIENHLEGK